MCAGDKVEFFNKLGGNVSCTDEEYDFACRMYTLIGAKNMLEYTLFYCTCDVLLLGECLLNTRRLLQATFGLDMCRYIR